MSNTTLSPDKNTTLSPRELSAAIFRLSDDRHAHADFALLKTLDPSKANDPQFTFSPRRYHPHILRALLALTTEQEILAARTTPLQTPTKPTKPTPSKNPKKSPAPAKKATVPGDSVAGQKPANQKKTPSQKSKNTPKSTGKTSSTLTPSQQSSSTTTVSPPTGE